MNKKNDIIMGLDISTSCIGICILEDDGSEHGKILELTHVNPKIPSKTNPNASLFLKKQVFQKEFLSKWAEFGITRVIIESPLLRSNNVNTVAVLLQFNGMISDAVFNTLGVIPEYISSYDARKFAFPTLMSVRKFNKAGEIYPSSKIIKALNKDQLVLFGNYPWDINKKDIIMGCVNEIYPQINWLMDKNGEFRKENFDSCDALVACIGHLNKERFGDVDISVSNIIQDGNIINYDIHYWNRSESKKIILS